MCVGFFGFGLFGFGFRSGFLLLFWEVFLRSGGV